MIRIKADSPIIRPGRTPCSPNTPTFSVRWSHLRLIRLRRARWSTASSRKLLRFVRNWPRPPITWNRRWSAAPGNGYVTQVLIRPGTYAAALPLRPVMVFIPEQKRLIVAQFRQNSLLRLEKGDDAEAVFNALPGQVFHGKLVSILPVVPGGSYQAQGALQSLTVTPGSDGVLATIELDPNAEIDALPDGIYAQVAVYSDHFTHVSVMRKVLLRMTSWMHYLYLDH